MEKSLLRNAKHASSLSQIEYLSREEVTLKDCSPEKNHQLRIQQLDSANSIGDHDSSIEPMLDEVNPSAISNFISEAFSLNHNAYVAEQISKRKSDKKTALMKAVESSKDKKNLAHKEAQMKDYRQRELTLNKSISKFLVSQYGNDGDLPPKEKKSNLIVQIKKKAHAKIADGRSDSRLKK